MQNAECRIKTFEFLDDYRSSPFSHSTLTFHLNRINRINRIIPYHPISRDTVIRFDTLC